MSFKEAITDIQAVAENPSHDNIANSVAHDASRANDAEHELTIWQGFNRYPKAVGWSILLSTCLVMEGYDVTLLGNLYSQPAFQKRFGISDGKGGFQISAPWQSGLSNTFNIGSVLGLLLAGTCAERYGYRRTLMTALTLITGFIFIVFFATNLTMLCVGEILCALCWGIFQTITVTYATEVCPLALRAYLTTYVNLCWVFGQLIGAGVLKGVVDRMDQWAYRIPFAIQWIWPVPLIIGIYFAPDSPWWEVRKGRHADARKSLLRLYSSKKDEDSSTKIDETLSLIIYTTELEKSQQKGTTYLDCFRGIDLRRTEIVCCVYSVQVFCGTAMMGWAVYFMEQAGFSPSDAFAMNVGQSAVGAVGTICSWFLIARAGRRKLYMYGTAGLALVLFIVGCLGIVTKENTNAQWTIGALIIVYTFIYDITIGPICYSLVPELSSTRLRNKSVVLARVTFNIASVLVNVLQPRMLNPTAWNWGAKSSFLWTGTCLMCVVWIYFRLPEPRGRTDAELDILFKNGVSARKFKTTAVDPFLYVEEIAEKLVRKEKEPASQHVEQI